jgi:beta-ureidopropionase / N-carbamoyl-L-amino-acid hydrolase
VERILERLDELYAIGSTRIGYSPEEDAAHALAARWFEEAGLEVEVDSAGNTFGRRGEAALWLGSHLDTVPNGGRFDGALGVLAALEVAERSDYPLAVVAFRDEERTCAGSNACVAEGRLPQAFLELHVEQGPVLEADGITIGAVTGVQGISWQELTIEGQSNHAGTTPMALRHDAAYAAARLTTFVRELAGELGIHQVATVGQVDLHPNLINVVAGRATMTVDLRNTDDATLQAAEGRVRAFSAELAAAEGVTITSRRLARFEPVEFDPAVVALVEATATRLGHSVRRLPSGAGHDAQMLARVCPTAMVFTPSVAGVSHNPAELTRDEDLEAGANVLLQVLLALAKPLSR